jgi:hypothetical protein
LAGAVRLFENRDFEQAMVLAAERHGVSEQFVENIDLFVNPREFDPELSRTGVDRTLKGSPKPWPNIRR